MGWRCTSHLFLLLANHFRNKENSDVDWKRYFRHPKIVTAKN